MNYNFGNKPEPEDYPSWQDYAKAEHRWTEGIKKELRRYGELLNSQKSELAHSQAVIIKEVLGK